MGSLARPASVRRSALATINVHLATRVTSWMTLSRARKPPAMWARRMLARHVVATTSAAPVMTAFSWGQTADVKQSHVLKAQKMDVGPAPLRRIELV